MSAPKHTPGPWRVERKSVFDNWTRQYGREFIEHVQIVTTRVLDSSGLIVVLSGDEGEANARLIAAAPEMLEGCERALAFVESMPNADNVGLADFLRAAIAKATGGTS